MEVGKQVEQDGGPDDEHPCVPVVFASLQEPACSRLVRLLHEGLDLMAVGSTCDLQGVTNAYVTKTGRRISRFDADGDNEASVRDRDRLTYAVGEHLRLPDDVVGGEGANHGIG